MTIFEQLKASIAHTDALVNLCIETINNKQAGGISSIQADELKTMIDTTNQKLSDFIADNT